MGKVQHDANSGNAPATGIEMHYSPTNYPPSSTESVINNEKHHTPTHINTSETSETSLQSPKPQPVQWPPATGVPYPPKSSNGSDEFSKPPTVNDGNKTEPMGFGQAHAVQWPPAEGTNNVTQQQHAGGGRPVASPVSHRAQIVHENSPYPLILGNQWSSQLFDCERNSDLAVITAFAPCITFGRIVNILDEGQNSCALGSLMYGVLLPILSCGIVGTLYRQKMRQKYNLIQTPAEDWILHLFCPCCALCQEYRELQDRGIDPSLGWLGYVAQQQQGFTSAPMMQNMNR